MKRGIVVPFVLILSMTWWVFAGAAQAPQQKEKWLQFLELDGTVGRVVPGGILRGDSTFTPRVDGIVYLPDGSLAFEREGFLIFPKEGLSPIFPAEGIREVVDEHGRRHFVPPGFHVVKNPNRERHFFIPQRDFLVPRGGRVVRDRYGKYHVLPPKARLAYDARERPFILPEGTRLETDANGRAFVVPDGGRLERDGLGRTLVVPPGAKVVLGESGRGYVVPKGMRLEALPSDTWPPRHAVLPPGAEVVQAGGRTYIVPKGGRLVREQTDLWPVRYKIVFQEDPG